MREVLIATVVATCCLAQAGAQSFSEPRYVAVQGTWYAASADGSLVVGAGPKVWTSALGTRSLSTLPNGVLYGDARDVSWDGTIIVGNLYSSTSHLSGLQAVVWSGPNRSVSPLVAGPLPSAVSGVSGNGRVIGGQCLLVRWRDRVWTRISKGYVVGPRDGRQHLASRLPAVAVRGLLVRRLDRRRLDHSGADIALSRGADDA